MRINRHSIFYSLNCAIILLFIATPARAANIFVNTTDDTSMIDCTLRDAITAANSNAVAGQCAAGDALNRDTIEFTANGIINLDTALPSLESNLTINGPGSASLIISAATAATTVLDVTGTGVIIFGLTITGGNSGTFGGGLRINAAAEAQASDLLINGNIAVNGGGGVYNEGTLTLSNVTVSNNSANSNGGGIYNLAASTLSISDSTVSNNSVSGGNGAGIFNQGTITDFTSNTIASNTGASTGGGLYSSTSVTINESTLTLNNASDTGGGINGQATVTLVDSSVTSNTSTNFGGGVNADAITLTRSLVSGNSTGTAGGGLYATSTYNITNSTISGNSANMAGFGGGAYLGGTSTLTAVNSTITGNIATGQGGGIWSAGTVNLTNSIISNNATSNCQGPGTETWNSNGYNIESADTCVLNATGDQVNTNPMLAATLQDNGGPTLTYALLDGSPAIDAANNATCTATDQRGALRPQDGDNDMTATCDVGAFEVGDLVDIINTGDFGSGGCFIATAAWGTAMADDVRYLRAFRDQYLLNNEWGKKFVELYYDVSPDMADKLREHDSLRSVVRMLLKPLVWLSKNIVDTEVFAQQTEDKP